MNAIILAILLTQQVEVGKVKTVQPEPKPEDKICKIKGDECKTAGPEFKPVCIKDGALKGVVRCDTKS